MLHSLKKENIIKHNHIFNYLKKSPTCKNFKDADLCIKAFNIKNYYIKSIYVFICNIAEKNGKVE